MTLNLLKPEWLKKSPKYGIPLMGKNWTEGAQHIQDVE